MLSLSNPKQTLNWCVCNRVTYTTWAEEKCVFGLKQTKQGKKALFKMNKKRVADNNRQNEYMQCATLWGECFVKHNGQGWLLIGFDLCHSTVQVIAMWNLHHSSSFEGLRCSSAQPAQPAEWRPVSPSLTTWQKTAEPHITKLITLPVQYSKQA